MKRWQEVLGKSHLRYLDISNNNLYDQGAICIIQALLEGPMITTADEKNNPSKGPAGSRRIPKLR